MQQEYASMQEIVCKKCGYAWKYAGTKARTSCSKCKTSVTLSAVDKVIQEINKTLNQSPSLMTEVQFPLSLWKDARLAQRFMALKSTGESSIILKVDSQKVL